MLNLKVFDGEISNDFLYDHDGYDIYYGNEGNDTLYGDDNVDIMYGGSGDDVLFGLAGTDILKGGSGDDRLYASSGNDRLIGGTGYNALYGGYGNDTADYSATILGVNANLSTGTTTHAEDVNFGIFGWARFDYVDTLWSIENLIGTNAADVLTGDDGSNRLIGNGGHDQINGGGGADEIEGGLGADVIRGGTGYDMVDAGNGHDNVRGGAGNDIINGGNGNDVIRGGSGADQIEGGANSGPASIAGDDLFGGTGGDSFIFRHGDSDMQGSGVDVIHDWEVLDTLVFDVRNTAPGANPVSYVADFDESLGTGVFIELTGGNTEVHVRYDVGGAIQAYDVMLEGTQFLSAVDFAFV